MSGVRWAIAVLLLLALAGVAGCQKQASEGQGSQAQRRAPQPPEAQASGAEIPQVAEPVRYAYDPLGKRDPFRSFVLERLREDSADDSKGPLEQFELSQLDILGVVWETNNARALVADPSGQPYIVSMGDRMGKNDGRVIQIEDNLVLVKETYVDYVGEKTTKNIEMRVRQGQGG